MRAKLLHLNKPFTVLMSYNHSLFHRNEFALSKECLSCAYLIIKYILVKGSPCRTKMLSYGNDSLYNAIASCFLYRGAQLEKRGLSLIKAAFSSNSLARTSLTALLYSDLSTTSKSVFSSATIDAVLIQSSDIRATSPNGTPGPKIKMYIYIVKNGIKILFPWRC